jgi:glycosyltransferase A (GT-A) superfamily protein (DUF2064 family)
MGSAMAHAFESGHSRVVLIGSDIPRLVLGPAEDGGYYLIGACAVPPVFVGIPWGGADVLRATVAAARAAGIEPEMVSGCYDVDDAHGLERLRADLAQRRVEGLTSTRAALERLRSMR